jgi:hypothetical protein
VSGDTSLATAVQRGPLDLAVLGEVALAATRDAAIACQPFVGRGDKHGADAAATEAMRRALAEGAGTRDGSLGTIAFAEGGRAAAPGPVPLMAFRTSLTAPRSSLPPGLRAAPCSPVPGRSTAPS